MFLVHVNVILNLQKRCTSLGDRYQRKTVFVVDVSINWESNRNGKIKLLDTWEVAQLNLPRQESVCAGTVYLKIISRTVYIKIISCSLLSAVVYTDLGPVSWRPATVM